jgi:hypothetical protein
MILSTVDRYRMRERLTLVDAEFLIECGDSELTEGEITLICELIDTVFSLLDSKVNDRPPLEIRMTS